MSEGGWVQPTSPTSGLAPYGGDGPQRSRGRKSRLKRLARQHRVHTAMQKSEDLTMSNYETLLTDLRKAVADAAAAPEGERDEILNKAFTALDEGLVNEVQLAIDESVGEAVAEADPIVGFTSELAKSAGDNEELAKGLTDVADFAYALQGIERMMERMAAIGEGKMCFPSMLSAPDLSMEDKEAQKEHAHAILDIITPYYSMGLVVLQRLTGATVADDEGHEMSPEDEDEVLKADMSDFFSRVSNVEITPEGAFEVLTKAFSPPPDDTGDDTSPQDPDDGQDDGDVDPLETIKRLAAAIMLQVSAIADSDQGEDPSMDGQPEDPQNAAPGQTGPQSTAGGQPPEKPFGKADLAQLMKSEIDNQLQVALSPLVEENAQLREQIEKLGKMAAPVALGKGAIDPQGREGGPVTAEDLAKMAPEDARRAVFKQALSNPIG